MPSTTLLVLAAGMGSRYGGLKQIDGVGPDGQTIIEYSVYDALISGFDKIVFIIRDEFKLEFQEKISNKFKDRVDIQFVNQQIDTPIEGISIKTERTKPWGTGHAVLVAREVISEPFAVINADDFYGRDAFKKMADFLRFQCRPELHGLVAYVLKNTLSEHGFVSRGVCSIDANSHMTHIKECTKIKKDRDGKVRYLENGLAVEVDELSPVSMNFWGFHPSIFHHLWEGFRDFVASCPEGSNDEYFIPLIVDHCIQNNKAHFYAYLSKDKWYGVTYQEDKPEIQRALAQMHREGLYPKELFG